MTQLRILSLCGFALLLAAGCTSARTSDTSRTGLEQLLISNAVDQALDRVDFAPLAGKKVYIEEKYLDCVDKGYVVGSVRHRALATGAELVGSVDAADQIVEIRSGGVGTDRSESFLGMPGLAVPGPLPVSLPEIQLASRKTQRATAKLGLVVYDAKSKQALGKGGLALARSNDSNWYLLGVGPFNSGSVKNEVSVATGEALSEPSVAAMLQALNNRGYGDPKRPRSVTLVDRRQPGDFGRHVELARAPGSRAAETASSGQTLPESSVVTASATETITQPPANDTAATLPIGAATPITFTPAPAAGPRMPGPPATPAGRTSGANDYYPGTVQPR